MKSSALVYGANYQDPYFFREDDDAHARRRAPTSSGRCSRSRRSCATSPTTTRTSTVTLLRFANVLGDDIDTPFAHALTLPVVPEIFGFDPRLQFVHEDDVVGALMYATTNDVPGRLQRRPATATCRGARCARSSASGALALPPVLTDLGRRAAAACCGSWTCRPRR